MRSAAAAKTAKKRPAKKRRKSKSPKALNTKGSSRRSLSKPPGRYPVGHKGAETISKQEAFCAAFSIIPTFTYAAQEAGINITTAYDWRANDSEFPAMVEAARGRFVDRVEEAAVKNAVDNKSESMQRFMLKAHRKDRYGDQVEVKGAIDHRHQLTSLTREQLEAELKELEAEDNAIEASYEVVQ